MLAGAASFGLGLENRPEKLSFEPAKLKDALSFRQAHDAEVSLRQEGRQGYQTTLSDVDTAAEPFQEDREGKCDVVHLQHTFLLVCPSILHRTSKLRA